jgi:hypothetical protein
MKVATFTITSEIWLYQGVAGWHFVTLPKKYGDEIKNNFKSKSKGWGSLPVTIELEKVNWKTSVFPDKKSGSYLLPIKSEIRKKLDLHSGDKITFILSL